MRLSAAEHSASWISEDLVRETLETFSAVYGRTLTKREAVEILRSVGLLLDQLGETS